MWALICGLLVQDPPKDERLPVSLSESSPQLAPGPDSVSLSLDAPAAEAEDELVVAPIPSYNPTMGAGLALGAGYLFPIGAAGPQTRLSMIGGGGYYSQSGSWAVGGGVKLHLDEDRWRLTAAGAGGQFFYQLAGVGTTDGDNDVDLDLEIRGYGLQLEALRRISGSLFGGLRFRAANVRTRLHDVDGTEPALADLTGAELEADIVAPGVRIQWDTRNSTFYPTEGGLADLVGDLYEESLGSDFEYQTYALAYNHYLGLAEGHVLAFRAYGRFTFGDVPFFSLSYFGQGADLRGYTVGTYQDRMLVAGQVEYRWRFLERWVAAGFAGLGQVAPDLDGFTGDDLLPSVGGGVRFTIAPENKISLRLDVAVGKDDVAVYFGVGEAF